MLHEIPATPFAGSERGIRIACDPPAQQSSHASDDVWEANRHPFAVPELPEYSGPCVRNEFIKAAELKIVISAQAGIQRLPLCTNTRKKEGHTSKGRGLFYYRDQTW
jgi:hypothetical protein